MKKIVALVMAMVMLCAAGSVLAEEGRPAPLYATVNEALEDSFEGRVIAGGMPGEYFAVVTQKDGKYYRSVAFYDEKLTELESVKNDLDFEAEDYFEKREAADKAAEDYLKTLPIAYSEEFTAQPLTNAEMESRLGKTLGELIGEGFEILSSGTEPGGDGESVVIAYTMRYGVFDYLCPVDADLDAYEAAQANDTENDLAVQGMVLEGITAWGFDQRFHTDGTVDEPVDALAEFNGILAEIMEMAEKAQAGEDFDMEGFSDMLKEKYPDYADMIDMYVMLYQTYGTEGFASMFAPAE